MRFIVRKDVAGWEDLECLPLTSSSIRSAVDELDHVGLMLGDDGLIVIEGGKK